MTAAGAGGQDEDTVLLRVRPGPTGGSGGWVRG